MKRLVGGLVIGGLCAMFALNLVWIAKNKQTLGGTKAGQDAPDLVLGLLDGGQQRLSDWRGQVVVLNFWATWCAPCVHELPDVQRLFEELSPKGVKFLAVDVDGGPAAEVAPLVRAFQNRIGLKMPIALDEGAASQAYRVDTIPRTVIIGKDGRVAEVLDGVHSLDDLRRAVTSAM